MKTVLTTLVAFVLLVSSKQLYAQEFEIINNEKTLRLDSLYSELFKYGEFNGNVLIAENGKIIYRKNYGIANMVNKKALDENSLFYLASVSKPFTATAILLLEKEEKLSLSDDMTKYIPELSFYRGITIENLVHHTSGLPDYMSLMDKKWDKSIFASINDIINFINQENPEVLFLPNEKWEYSNTGYLLLASIVERVSNKTYNEFLKENIFIPLDMNDTGVLFVHKDNLNFADLAIGYEKDSSGNFTKDIKLKYLDGNYGPGGIYSTINDLYKFDRGLKNNRIVNQNDKEKMFTSSKLNSGEKTGYGFGWFVENKDPSGKIVRHSGNWPGYKIHFSRHLDSDKTIILLQNNANATGKMKSPTAETRNILYGLPVKKDVRLPTDLLQEISGVYITKEGKEDSIILRKNSLWIEMYQMQFELIPISQSKFKVEGFRPDVIYEFTKDKDGNIAKYRVQQLGTGVDRTAKRKK